MAKAKQIFFRIFTWIRKEITILSFRVSVQPPELGPPIPYPANDFGSPPGPNWGEPHSLAGEGVGVNILEDARHCSVPELIDPVFVKTSPKRSFSVIQNERFGLVFVKTGSIISGLYSTYVSTLWLSLFVSLHQFRGSLILPLHILWVSAYDVTIV